MILPWGLCCPARPYLVELGWDSGLSRELRPSYGILVATTFLKRIFGHLVWRRCSWRCWLNPSFLVLKPKILDFQNVRPNLTPPKNGTIILQGAIGFPWYIFLPGAAPEISGEMEGRKVCCWSWRWGRRRAPKKTGPAESGFLKKAYPVSRGAFFRFYVYFLGRSSW